MYIVRTAMFGITGSAHKSELAGGRFVAGGKNGKVYTICGIMNETRDRICGFKKYS